MKYILTIIAVLVSIAINSKDARAELVPQLNPCGASPLNVSSLICQTAPQIYQVTIFEIGLCKGRPISEPTISTPADNIGCSTIYSNPTGSTVELSGSSSLKLSGGQTFAPEIGTYDYAYVLLSNVGGVSASLSFSSPMKGTVGGSGSKCWTLDSLITNREKEDYFLRNSDFSFKETVIPTVQCSNVAGSPGFARTRFNSLISNGWLYSTNSFGIKFSDTETVVTGISLYILDNNNLLVNDTTRDNASRLRYVTPINSNGNIMITENTNIVEIEFNNSVGAEVNVYNGNSISSPDQIGYLNFISIAGFGLRFSAN